MFSEAAAEAGPRALFLVHQTERSLFQTTAAFVAGWLAVD